MSSFIQFATNQAVILLSDSDRAFDLLDEWDRRYPDTDPKPVLPPHPPCLSCRGVESCNFSCSLMREYDAAEAALVLWEDRHAYDAHSMGFRYQEGEYLDSLCG